MGETLAETRVEIAARRADNESTAAELDARVRHALDVKARFRENPLIFIGLGAGAVFLLAGGPALVFRFARRRVNPSAAEQAYDALPAPMQAWVDTLVSGSGPKAQKARDALVEELARWRHDPIKDKKARKELGPRHGRWAAGAIADGLEGGGDGGGADRGRARPPGDRGPRHRREDRSTRPRSAAPTSVASTGDVSAGQAGQDRSGHGSQADWSRRGRSRRGLLEHFVAAPLALVNPGMCP